MTQDANKTIAGSKYILTGDPVEHNGHMLTRIRAIRSFGDVKDGELGGWVENLDNLAHDGDCWIAGNAKVYGSASVQEDAQLRDNAEARGGAIIRGNAQMIENSLASHSTIYANAVMRGRAEAAASAVMRGDSEITKQSSIRGNALVQGNAVISASDVTDSAIVSGDTLIFDQIVGGTEKIGGPREDKRPHLKTDVWALKRWPDAKWDEIEAIIHVHGGKVIVAPTPFADSYPEHRTASLEFPIESADEARTHLRREGFILTARELFRLEPPAQVEAPKKEPKPKKARKAKAEKSAPSKVAKASAAKVKSKKPPAKKKKVKTKTTTAKEAVIADVTPKIAHPRSISAFFKDQIGKTVENRLVALANEFNLTLSARFEIKKGELAGASQLMFSGDIDALAAMEAALAKEDVATTEKSYIRAVSGPIVSKKVKKTEVEHA